LRDSARRTPSYAVLALEKSVQEAALYFNFFVVVKWKIVATNIEAKVLESGASVSETFYISSQMEQYASPITDTENGHLDRNYLALPGLSMMAENNGRRVETQ
jgi:hypothetical protein